MNDTSLHTEPPAGTASLSGAAGMPRKPTSRILAWFIHDSVTDAMQRQRLHVFVLAHFTGTLSALLLILGVYLVAPVTHDNLQWQAPLTACFVLLPFGLRATGRLDIMGALSAQLFAIVVLMFAHDYGGIASPVLPWMVLAVATALYYLSPWPRWRNVNLVVQFGLLAAYAAFHLAGWKPGLDISDDTLLIIGLFSNIALLVFFSAVTLQIWSIGVAKQRELEREVAVRGAIEEVQLRTAEEMRRGRDHLAQSQRVGKIGSAEIVYWPRHEARWSDALFALFDRDPILKPPLGEPFLDYVHADDRAIVRHYREREARGDYPRATEFRIVRPNGQHRWIRRQAEPIEWRDGTPMRAIATYLDVTEQKDAQQAVVDLEEQLSQAHKMEAIGQLTGGVAHDFNNLLAVLLGRLQMINEELELAGEKPLDAAMLRDWVGSCIKAVDRGATLTKSMLAFSRQQALTPVALDVNSVIADMEEMLRRALGETYRLVVTKEPALWRTEADAGQLQNALLNLILNGRDASPDGGVLTIETHNRIIDTDYVVHHLDVETGDYVELAVSDAGSGMSPETVRRAFEPFFTTKEVGKGSGLGLSMVYGFVKQSGGHVAIESELGIGTTVRIFLPRKDTSSAPEAVSAAPVVSRGQSETILIVEDNEELLDVTRRQLQRMGYAVLQASHAAAGLDLLNQNPRTKLLLTDIVLPFGMNGVELAEKAMGRFPALKVVFMSGYNDEHDALKRVQGQFQVRLLQKPFQPSELAAQIRAALASTPRKPS